MAIAGYPEFALSVWDFQRNACTMRRFHGSPVISQLTVTPDRATLAFANFRTPFARRPRQVVLFRPDQPQPLSYVVVPRTGLRDIALSPCGRSLATASSDSGVIVWDLPQPCALVPALPVSAARRPSVSPDIPGARRDHRPSAAWA